ncbi:hypothetical protein G6O69_38240 [Pseudenhygromyxa sp. WMMC2535]|nr:hypothetical protein [Pseudenhygromyxa sp. WMMC2535]NVB43707.1 hypothetical protein [Pseudenhygromyxa sp. WMMC2535]
MLVHIGLGQRWARITMVSEPRIVSVCSAACSAASLHASAAKSSSACR